MDAKGRPDLLAKHLKRLVIARQNSEALANFTGLKDPTIHAGLVFSNTVPMQFAVERMSEKLWTGTIKELDTLDERSDQ